MYVKNGKVGRKAWLHCPRFAKIFVSKIFVKKNPFIKQSISSFGNLTKETI
jgi:hypothetical protein